jgi:hypothetical protein
MLFRCSRFIIRGQLLGRRKRRGTATSPVRGTITRVPAPQPRQTSTRMKLTSLTEVEGETTRRLPLEERGRAVFRDSARVCLQEHKKSALIRSMQVYDPESFMAVIFGKNALSAETIGDLLSYAEDKKKEFVWGSNFHMWSPNLTIATGAVLTHALPGERADAIYRELAQRGTLPYYPNYRSIMFYSWFAGSNITWHFDYQDKSSMTVYLCEDWKPNDGGYFCWKEWSESFPKYTYDSPPDECQMRLPIFNDYVYITEAEWHTTTITAPSAPPRFTLQMFFSKPSMVRQRKSAGQVQSRTA